MSVKKKTMTPDYCLTTERSLSTSSGTECNNTTHDTTNISLFEEFAAKSTIHGLPQTVAAPRYTGQRYLWGVLFITMTAGLILTVSLQVKSYFQYPTTVDSMEKPLALVDVPDVIVCNQKPVRFEKASSIEGNIAVDEQLDDTTSSSCTYPYSGHCLLDSAIENYRPKIYLVSFGTETWVGSVDRYVDRKFTSIGLCERFGTVRYINRNWFNPVSDVPGLDALEMVIYYRKDHRNVSHNGLRVGLQVSLYEQDMPAFPEWRRVFLPINSSCSIIYHRTTKESLSSPFQPFVADQCVDTKSGQFVNPLKRYDVYTTDSCRSECFVDFVVRTCGCRFYLHPGNETMCTREQMYNCTAFKTALFEYSECNCTLPCYQTEYTMSASCETIYKPPLPLIHLEITSDGPTQTKIIQRPVNTLESLLGSVGGLIGLFMGFSLVSLVELLEFLCLMCKQTATHSCSAKMRTRK